MEEIKKGYTRVSEILNQWDKYGHIDDPFIKDKVEAKALIGTEVHEAIKAHHEGIYFPLSHRASKYFESYELWHAHSKFTTVHCEQRLYDDDLKITGAIDAIGVFPGSEDLHMVDFKTSAVEDKKFWPLQAGFYHMLCRKNGIHISNTVIFVKLQENMPPKVCQYIIDERILLVCMAAYNTYTYINS